MHGTGEVDLVLVVHGDADHQLCLAGCSAVILTELVSSVNVVIRIASNGSVPHVRELDIIAPGQEGVENRRNFALEDKLAIDKFDFLP